MNAIAARIVQKDRTHDGKMDRAYNAGYNDGRAGNVYRFSPLDCVCTACQEIYKMGFEYGQLAENVSDE